MSNEGATRREAQAMPADRPRASASAPRAVPVNRSPLSFAQQRLWFLSQIEGASEAYHIFSAWRLLGRLNSGALRKALDRIIVRHEALRTTFAVVDAAPVQQVAPAPGCRFALVEEDWRTRTDSAEALERLMRQESVRPFDLRTGPMIRGYLVRLTDMEHALLVTMHHIVSDGWSTGVLINEFCALYGAFCEGRPDPLPPLALQYPGYSLWQRRFLEGPRMQQHVEYWRKALAGAPTILELPADFPRPPRQQFAGSFAELRIDEALTVRLKEMSRKHGVTLYMTLLAAWALLSGRLSGQSDVIIGTPVANRERTELQPMIGLFVNTLALRLNVEGSQTVAQLLKQVRVDTFAAFQHQDIPFEQVVDVVQPKRTLAHSPLFQVMFQWQALPGGALTLPELRVEPMRSAEAMPASKFDMTLSLGEINGGITGGIEYATALFAPETVAMYGRYLRALLEAMAADDTRSLGHLPLLSAVERQRLVAQWNLSTAAAPTQRYVHELFEDQASATPDALAVVSAGRNLSYRELNERASRVASYLRTHGVGPDDRVAICVERSPEMLISILGVLKAGASYVPVDPGYPADRMAYMLEECAPRVILTQECVKQKLPPALPAVAIDLEWSEIESCLPFEGDRVTTGLMPENLAYVIFTSGSTGRPKGTSVEHRGLSNLLQWYTGEMAGIDLNRVLIVSSFSFDLTQKNLLVPLLTGGQVHLAAEPFDPAAIARQIEAEGITAMNLTPSALYAILESCDARRLSSLRKVVLGGEAITAVRLTEFARACPQVQIINNYGPTESTDVASVCTLPGADELARGPQIPIGRALPNMRLYILDAYGEPVPTGVSGELYLGGIGVARGYLHRPELTAQRFVADAFSDIPGARAYRTGDLARYRRDGQIEFQGRNDFQVKLRGYRIELGEIEAGLLAFEGIRQAVVVAREDSTGDKRLVAYYTATPGGEAVTAEQLRTHLSSLLPAYMVPAAYMRLEQLPLTPSGKLDRRSLPSPDASAYAAPEYEAPQGPMETTMAAIWGELLEVDRIGRHDDFFERGGHSLLMLKLVMRLQQAFGLDVKITDVFEHPVLADLARALQNARGQRAILPPITRADRRQRLPLTFAQQRLWFLAQMEGGSDAYNLSFGMRLEGQLNYAALRRALDRIIARHESLRTTFTFEDGTPAQRIAPIEESRFHLVEHDLSRDPGWKMRVLQLEQEEARQSFDFVRGPLIRGLLIRFSDRTHVLRISLHHVICDGWSLRVVRREIAALYDAFSNDQPDPLPELPIQHADFAVWQRQWSGGDVLGRQGEYWKARLAGAPALLELPTDHPRPPRQDYAGSVAKVVLDEKLSGAIRVLARRHDATLYMTLLAAWAALMSRLSGQTDIVIGTPVANRLRAETENLIGFFSNNLTMRLVLSGSPTVGELVDQARKHALEAQRNQDIPFEHVVELVQPVRSLNSSPLFQVMFAWRIDLKGGSERAPAGLQIDRKNVQPRRVTSRFDITISLQDTGKKIVGGVEYATSLFEKATIDRYLGYFRNLLKEMVADDSRLIEQLPILGDAERQQLLYAWNDTRVEFAGDPCIHELFEAQVRRAPDETAVIFEGERLTYAGLNSRANRLAHHLRKCGVRPGERVALCLERGFDMFVALMAVLKAGGAYVPLDPAYPADRLRFMLQDCAPVALLTRGTLADSFVTAGLPVLDMGAVASPWSGEPDRDPDRLAVDLTSGHLAYVIYTSGSTGQPKGVMITHAGACNTLRDINSRFSIRATDRVLAVSSVAFDLSVYDVFGMLAQGGALVVPPTERVPNASGWRRLVREHGVTVWNSVPALMQLFAEAGSSDDAEACESIRVVMLSGDWVPVRLVEQLRALCPNAAVYSLGGATEASIWSVCYPTVDLDPRRTTIPYGRALANQQIHVLDKYRQPCPVGVVGELYLGGAGVAVGYLNRPELTEERFLRDPFATDPRARIYRTGDLGRWLPDGNVEFLGRNDFQVKVRGFRIELGEIEARLVEHAAVREAVVTAREDSPGDKRLVAYYTVADEAVTVEQLRAHLAAVLPEYMVPTAFVSLEALPLTPNGKVDRQALPAPDGGADGRSGYEPPQGRIETELGAIWTELLQVERVGRRDNFFALGGHSLLGMRLVVRVRQRLKLEIRMSDVFTHPVLADLARQLEGSAVAALPPIMPVDRSGDLPLSLAQQRLWFLAQLEGAGEAYELSIGLVLEGELDALALRRALDRMVLRHESLRTTFVFVDNAPRQRIASPEDSRFELIERDLRDHPEWQRELRRLYVADARRGFDLEAGPLIRGHLVRLSADKHALRIAMHHIIADGWSIGLMAGELSTLYSSFRAGRPDPMPPLTIQYGDYAAWQRHWIEGEILNEQGEYWKATLAGAPALLELPTDHPRPARQQYAGGVVRRELDEKLTEGIEALSRRHGMTMHMTLLAAWTIVLSRLSGQRDVVIGTPVANRRRLETEKLIGCFVNTLALRVDLEGRPTVAELLNRVKVRSLEAQQHQDIPFEHVVELVQPVRSLAHTPLFQVMFQWQAGGEGTLELPGLSIARGRTVEARRTAKFDQHLSMAAAGGRLFAKIEYATALFEQATIERQLDYFGHVLAAMAADDTQRIERLPLLGAAERQQLLYGWNDTRTESAGDVCIHELIEVQAAQTPQAIALVCADTQLSYLELNARANRLAHALRQRGVRPDCRVGICLERGVDLVIALLAVLKAGGAYVPLDAEYPIERLRFMVADSEPTVLLTRSHLLDKVAGDTALSSVMLLDSGTEGTLTPSGSAIDYGLPSTNLDRESVGLHAHHLAYVIYTSGSTGQPKGVAIEHRNTVNLLMWGRSAFATGQLSDTLFSTSLNFDLAVYECLLPLSIGATVHLVTNVLDLSHRQVPVTLINTVPSAMLALLQAQAVPETASTINLAGEPLTRALVERIFTKTQADTVCNLYGPTETTTYSTWTAIRRGEPLVPHIGRPIANTRVYLLDEHGEPVPTGVVGELYIGGAGVARGYLNRPELTAGKFLRDPFVQEPDARMYRTGDLARWRPDGNLEFLGRNDFQVKVRGFRIELGEIEARLLEQNGVREAVVVAREESEGEKRLVAYYTADPTVDGDWLRTRMATVLPQHMVPSVCVRLEALPRTPNGKVNRQALPSPEASARATSIYEPPQGEIETALAEIWARLLGLDRVGRSDNFFALGGHSLLAMRLVAAIRQGGATITPMDPFIRPTLKDLAACLCAPRSSVHDEIVRFREGESERSLFLIHDGADSLQYVHALTAHLPEGMGICGVPPPAVDDTRFRTVEAMAGRLVGLIREVQPEGPYHVAGWSLGGTLAYETANQLLRAGQTVRFLALIDAVYAPGLRESAPAAGESTADEFDDKSFLLGTIQLPTAFRAEGPHFLPALARIRAAMQTLDFDDLVSFCREESVLPQDLADLSAAQIRQALLRRHGYRQAQLAYRAAPIAAPVHLFAALESLHAQPLLGWQAVLPPERIHSCRVPGNHYSIMDQTNIGVLARELSGALQRHASR